MKKNVRNLIRKLILIKVINIIAEQTQLQPHKQQSAFSENVTCNQYFSCHPGLNICFDLGLFYIYFFPLLLFPPFCVS